MYICTHYIALCYTKVYSGLSMYKHKIALVKDETQHQIAHITFELYVYWLYKGAVDSSRRVRSK